MGKVVFHEDRCIGCGTCCNIASENFTYSDEGRASIINENITEEAIEASEMCPTRAIEIQNSCNCCDSNCECSDDCNCECSDDCNCENDCCCDHCSCE